LRILTAFKKLAILPAYGRLLSLQYFCTAVGQDCRARLPGKAAGHGYYTALKVVKAVTQFVHEGLL
jgi:hypothetical protein